MFHALPNNRFQVVFRSCFVLVFGIFWFQGNVSQSGMSSCRANDNQPAVVKQARGNLKSIDIEKGVVTLHPLTKGANKDVAFSLAGKDIVITTDAGQNAKLSELKPGVFVTLGLSAVDDVVAIQAKAPRQYGFVKAIDPVKRTITIQGNKKNPDPILSVGKDAKIYLNEDQLKLEEMFPGVFVRLVLSLDNSNCQLLQGSLRWNGTGPKGVILSADPNKHTIQLLMGTHEKFKVATYPVAEKFYLTFNNRLQKIKLSDLPSVKNFNELPRALPVWMQLDKESKKVEIIMAKSATIPGLVKKVDPGKRVLTVKTSFGEETLPIAKDAEIYLKSKQATIANITPGMSLDLHLGLNAAEIVGIRSSKAKTKIAGEDID